MSFVTLLHVPCLLASLPPCSRDVFESNVRTIDAHNAAGKSWTMAVNSFTHLSGNEFASTYIGGESSASLGQVHCTC